MESTVSEFIEHRRAEDRDVSIHVAAHPDAEGVREVAERACNLVRGDEAPALEGLDALPDAPDQAAILVEASRSRIAPNSLSQEEWRLIRSQKSMGRIHPHHYVIVAETLPADIDRFIDLRIDFIGDDIVWSRVTYDPYADTITQRELDGPCGE